MIVILIVIVLVLLWKTADMHRAARELREGLAEKLAVQTNTLLTIDSRDKAMCQLADALNGELRRLRTLRWQYEQGNQALQETITNISHDIRTPLTVIYGYLELLEQEEKSADAGRYLQIIKEKAETLRSLTEELFVYALSVPAEEGMNGINVTDVSEDKKSGRKYEEVVINRVLEEGVAGFYGVLSAHRITPQITMPKEPVIRRLIPSALLRILENILQNAVKYSDGDLQISLSKEGELRFSNHASGLDAVQAGRLFERFYTVENAEHATGLGLSIARLLTERMGGSIKASYEEGVFTVYVLFPPTDASIISR